MTTWTDIISAEKEKPYFQNILHALKTEKAQGVSIFPQEKDIFNAFDYTPFDDVKVVIIGQDPYHGPNQAHGLAFSVQANIDIPPSLRNIFKELKNDVPGFQIPEHGTLTDWAQQGVLLLNTVLTVRQAQAHSHQDLGWEIFTDHIIDILNTQKSHLVFLLWGSHAQKKGRNINQDKHLILNAPHPSPLSAYRGFLGCQHFSKTNQYLKRHHVSPINWQINPS